MDDFGEYELVIPNKEIRSNEICLPQIYPNLNVPVCNELRTVYKWLKKAS